MRAYFAIYLSLLAINMLAQNPDGDVVSVHFTPFFTEGKYEFVDLQTGKSDGDFGFSFKLTIPVSHSLTFSPFVESEFYEFQFEDLSGDNNQFNDLKFRQTRYGMGISIYFK